MISFSFSTTRKDPKPDEKVDYLVYGITNGRFANSDKCIGEMYYNKEWEEYAFSPKTTSVIYNPQTIQRLFMEFSGWLSSRVS